jgi:hypothetical protein
LRGGSRPGFVRPIAARGRPIGSDGQESAGASPRAKGRGREAGPVAGLSPSSDAGPSRPPRCFSFNREIETGPIWAVLACFCFQ